MEQTKTYKAGYAALIGEPNVGKSTLLNALLRQKLSIVTNKPQTTRQRVLGIVSTESYQIVFLDTPGIIEPKYLLQREMMKHSSRALEEADVIVALADAYDEGTLPDIVLKRLEFYKTKKPLLLVLNKADLLAEPAIEHLIQKQKERGIYDEVIALSALKKKNVDSLEKALVRFMPEHPAYYPEDIASEHPERFFAAELLRERIFEQFSDEIPYATAVDIREFKEREAGKTFISADIIVERDSQKGILIGKKGEALKKLGQAARKEIESFLQHPVFLELHVTVRKHWRENATMMQRFGYKSEEEKKS
jgi:GTP-binding protein Era